MDQQSYNPFLPSYEYVPDGEPRVFGDRLYLYGSHDAFGAEDFCVNDYVCYSAPTDNLADWRYEGVIYRKDQDPRNPEGKMHMCAPDCVQGPDGRYYLYYQLHALQCTCVAVSDKPAGPFAYHGCVRHPDGTPWGEKKGDSFAFDPGVLVDDDGKVYLYVGFSTTGMYQMILKMRGNKLDGSVCLQLGTDMCTVIGEEKPIVPGSALAKGTAFEKHPFFEASSIRKINGTYYYVYSSLLSHELCYATSSRPDGGFVFGGTIVSIADIGLNGNTVPKNYTGNTHGGMVEVNGQWYIFYHRQTNRVKCSRQACAEKISILPDGSIPQVEVTSCGLNSGPLRGTGTYEARIACNLGAKTGMVKSDDAKKADKKGLLPFFTQSGADREENGDQYLANLRDGSWCAFKYFSFDGTESKISVSGSGSGTFQVSTDPAWNTTAAVVGPGSTAPLSVPKGTHALYFRYSGNDAADFVSFTISSK